MNSIRIRIQYQNPTFLLKDLSNIDETKNEKIADYVNDALIYLTVNRKQVNRKEIRKSEKFVVLIIEILKFNKQQKGKGLPLNLAKNLATILSILKKITSSSCTATSR